MKSVAAALGVAWLNVIGLVLFYGAKSAALVAVAGGDSDRALVVAHVTWLALAVGAAAVLLGRLRRELAALVWACAWFLALVDTRVYLLLGVHLSSSVVVRTLAHERALAELGLGASTLVLAALLLVIGFAVELYLHVAAARLALGRASAALAIALGGCAAVAGAWEAHARAHLGPLSQAALEALPLGELPRPAARYEIHYPRLEAGSAPHPTRRTSVLFVVVESLRADALKSMPRLQRFADEAGTVRSGRHFSGAHSTEFAIFELLYGLGADHQRAFLGAAETPPSWPLKLLALDGYQLAGASASFLSGWGASGRITAQLGAYQEFLDGPAWQNDRRIVDWAKHFAGSRERARPFFLFLFFNSTHHSYSYPPEFERHRPVLSEQRNQLLDGETLGRRFRGEVTNRYLNSVEYVDSLLGELLDTYAGEIARGELIVVVTGDHGEELWDHGLYGHVAPTLTDERVSVPLVLHVPGEAPRAQPASTHADLWPTIVDALGLEPKVPPAFWSTGVSLLAPPGERTLYVHASGYPEGDRAARTVSLIDGNRKFRVVREPGRVPRFQLEGVTDLEDRPVAAGPAETARFRELALGLGRDAFRFIK